MGENVRILLRLREWMKLGEGDEGGSGGREGLVGQVGIENGWIHFSDAETIPTKSIIGIARLAK